MIDLRSALIGTAAQTGPQRPPTASVRSFIVCECGGRLACTYTDGAKMWGWMAGYRLTPRGAAVTVMDAALEDFEAIGEIAAKTPGLESPDLSAEVACIVGLVRAHSVESLTALIPHLNMPAHTRPLAGLAAFQAAHEGEQIAGMDAGCPNCRSVRYVGEQMVRADADGRHAPRTMVAQRHPTGLGVERFGHSWPPERRAERMRLYRELTAMP